MKDKDTIFVLMKLYYYTDNMIKINGTNVTAITFGSDMKWAQMDSGYIWAKPYTLTRSGSTTYINVTLYRYSSDEPTAATGSSATLASGATIYHHDRLYCYISSTVNTRYCTKTCSPDSFSGNYVYVYANETITFNSYACSCGSTNSSSTCTTCASTSCSSSASGLCSTAAYRKCNCKSTSIAMS